MPDTTCMVVLAGEEPLLVVGSPTLVANEVNKFRKRDALIPLCTPRVVSGVGRQWLEYNEIDRHYYDPHSIKEVCRASRGAREMEVREVKSDA